MVVGKVYEAPVVNQTPPIDRAGRWSQIKDLRAPFPATGTSSFGYWFNYLWEEARAADDLSAGDRGLLCDAFFAVLVSSGTAFAPRTDGIATSDDTRRRVLTTLLVHGFRRVSLPGAGAAGGAVSAVDAGEVFARTMEVKEKGNAVVVHLGFRADGRKYEDLIAQGGFRSRARSQGQRVHSDYGLDAPWNPFSIGVYGGSLFLRKGENKDNCLHTVVSVGLSFPDLLPYPLLSDPTLFRWATTPLTSWTPVDEAGALSHRYAVRAVREDPAGPIDHLESEIRIFVLAMDRSRAFSTMGWQKSVGVANPFPEAAVDQVALEDVIAEIEVTRKHWFDGRSLTFYDFSFRGTRLLPSRQAVALARGHIFPSVLEGRLSQLESETRHYWGGARALYDRARHRPAAVAVASVECPSCHQKMKPGLLAMHRRVCR